MKTLDLDTFAKTLTEKGYDGYFLTDGGYPDKLKDSISRFLEACENGTDQPLQADSLLLKTYLEWQDEDKPYTDCYMDVRHEDGKFDVQEINIKRKDRYGNILKKSELTNLTTETVPTVKEALARVIEEPQKKKVYRKRGFRF